MKLRLTAAILILAAATSVAAQPATAPFNPLVNVSNTSALRSDLADISMFGATTYVAWVEDNAAGSRSGCGDRTTVGHRSPMAQAGASS